MRRIVALLLVVAVAACSNTSGKALSVDTRPSDSIWYVERHPQDGRDMASIIAGALRTRGVEAFSGGPDQRPDTARIVVTYQDRWMWDMRMYLLDLRIDVLDADTRALIAYGQSYQDSLAALGKNQLDIVNRALDQILPRTGARTAATP